MHKTSPPVEEAPQPKKATMSDFLSKQKQQKEDNNYQKYQEEQSPSQQEEVAQVQEQGQDEQQTQQKEVQTPPKNEPMQIECTLSERTQIGEHEDITITVSAYVK